MLPTIEQNMMTMSRIVNGSVATRVVNFFWVIGFVLGECKSEADNSRKHLDLCIYGRKKRQKPLS